MTDFFRRTRPYVRLASASLIILIAACSDGPTNAVSPIAEPSFKTVPTPAGIPNLSGHWVESPKLHYVLPDGRAQEVWYEFDAQQSGTTLSGTVRRYVSYFDVGGNPTVVRFDLGSPGKLSGTVGATSATIGFLRVNENKQNLGYSTTISNDASTLTVLNPTQYGAKGFVR
jgi:hypothetical protein